MNILRKVLTSTGITGLLLLVTGSAYSQMRWNYGWHGPGMMYSGSWLWMIIPVVFWILIIVGIVFLIRWIVRSSRTMHGKYDDSALEILKRRYAKGEINKEEFEQKKRDIE